MRAALVASALALCAAAWAQGAPRAELMQKALFTKRLLEASPPAAATDDAAAMYSRALDHLDRGEEREAEARLNEAHPLAAARAAAGRRRRALRGAPLERADDARDLSALRSAG